MKLARRLPPNDELRRRVYQGEIFLLPATTASRNLINRALKILRDQAEQSPEKDRPAIVREALEANTLTPHEMAALKALHTETKAKISGDEEGAKLLRELLSSLGFAKADTVYDALRLRLVMSGDCNKPENARSHSVHRDIWYANSSSQINFWLPLRDVTEEETFSFLTEYWDKLVANTSADFDYDRWMSTTGWQNTTITEDYPRVIQEGFAKNLDGSRAPGQSSQSNSFAAYAGEILIFSAAHLHQTNPLDNGKARLSLDFRAVNLSDDRAGTGAPNRDNASTGSATRDYKKL